MEVASIITSKLELLKLFGEFIYSYKELILVDKNEDTAYFVRNLDGKYEIYYHFELDNTEYEFEINYSEEEKKFITNHFEEKPVYIIDISIRNKNFFYKMISNFKQYLASRNQEYVLDMILGDPFEGLIVINGSGQVSKL